MICVAELPLMTIVTALVYLFPPLLCSLANSPRLGLRKVSNLRKKGGFRGRSPLTCIPRGRSAPQSDQNERGDFPLSNEGKISFRRPVVFEKNRVKVENYAKKS